MVYFTECQKNHTISIHNNYADETIRDTEKGGRLCLRDDNHDFCHYALM